MQSHTRCVVPEGNGPGEIKTMSGDAARHSEPARHNNALTDAMVAAAPQCSQAPHTWLAFPPQRPWDAGSGRELTGCPTRWPASG